MKLIRTEDAVGHVLCHDMTQIIKDAYKDARFRKGHVVTEEDIPVLLRMGKESLYVYEMTPGMVHENDAAERLLALCGTENMERSQVKEGKIKLKAACDGLFRVDSQRLLAVNGQDEVMIATRKGNTAVRKGDKLAGMRVIPLIIEEEKLRRAEEAAGGHHRHRREVHGRERERHRRRADLRLQRQGGHHRCVRGHRGLRHHLRLRCLLRRPDRGGHRHCRDVRPGHLSRRPVFHAKPIVSGGSLWTGIPS